VNLSEIEQPWINRQYHGDRWNLQISPELAWDLDINAGAVDGQIDLTGVPIKRLNCSVGAGNMEFILDKNGANSQFNIDAGASNIELQIPGDTGVSIELDGALSANNLDELGWTRTGNQYVSPNYEKASSRVDCNIDLSVGNLTVKMGSNI
jgi:hypothetical protein